MNIFLDDNQSRQALYPFTFTRHVADIRVGILTIREKWETLTGLKIFTEESDRNEESIVIDAALVPTSDNYEEIVEGARNNALSGKDTIKKLEQPWNIFQLNDWALRKDFELLTKERTSQALSTTNQLISPGNIFIEEGAIVEYCMLNASTGPIYIGKDALLMEGCMIRGPFSIGENAVLKMGSKIYGATTIGPHCTGGGEIKNSVLFAHSNKAHDGYLGDSVIGEWCNLGAGTSNSNVKNTGGDVKYITGNGLNSVSAGNKAGLLMGDYSRAAINTAFNTGTIVGVCCNVFGEAPAKLINNFSWGRERYIFEKVISDISNWKKMKGQELTENEIEMLRLLYSNNQ